MNFLAPIFAWASLVALPIVLFYLAREEPVRRVVSSLMFWERVSLRGRESARWLRVRRWVSLLAQLVFVGLVVVALMRPVSFWPGGGTRSVMVLDGSGSMRALDVPGGRFHAAVSALRQDASRTRPADRMAVLLTGNPPRGVSGWMPGGSMGSALLEGLVPDERAVDPSSTLALARDMAGEGGRVVFYTDGVWDGEGIEPELMEGVDIRRVGSVASNAGITLFAARRSETDPARLYLLAQMAGRDRHPPRLTVSRDGKVLDVREPTWGEGGKWSADWVLDAPGAVELSAAIPGGDILASDDTAELSVPALATLRVMLVSPPDIFLEAALDAVPGVRTIRIWPPDLPPGGDPEALWVFRGVTPPDDFPAAARLFIAPERGGAFGELLGDHTNNGTITAEEDNGPLRHAGFSKISPAGVLAFKPAQGAAIFARIAETPLVFGEWGEDIKWLVLAFDPSRGDLVTRTAFPIFIANIIQDVRSGSSEGWSAPVPGRAVTKLQPSTSLEEGDPALSAMPVVSAWTGFPPWWMLLAAAGVWLLIEWAAYQRRVLE
jgi:hypothetical protein